MLSVMLIRKDKLIQTIILEQKPNLFLLTSEDSAYVSLFPLIVGGHLNFLRKVALVNIYLRTVAESKFQYINCSKLRMNLHVECQDITYILTPVMQKRVQVKHKFSSFACWQTANKFRNQYPLHWPFKNNYISTGKRAKGPNRRLSQAAHCCPVPTLPLPGI